MKGKRLSILAALLMSLCLLAGLFAGCTENGPSANPSGSETASASESELEAIPEGYHQVRFALPYAATEQDKEYTTLPDDVLVPDGTKIGALVTPRRISSIFLGWNYDDEGNETADPDDVVDRNMTLYPRFALQDGMDGTGSLTYVSDRDVPADFAFELISYGLTEEEVRELLSLENASLCLDNLGFTLTSRVRSEQLQWILSLGLGEETAEKAEALVQKELADEAFELMQALTELASEEGYDPNAKDAAEDALDVQKIEKIVAHFAPEELNEGGGEAMTGADGESVITRNSDPLSGEELDEELQAVLGNLDVDIATATEAEIKAAYGLAEDDSLQRFWREDVGLSVEQVQQLEDLLLNREPVGDRWQLRPESGSFTGGELYSLTIKDTAKLRFVYRQEETDPAVVEYNVTIHQDEVKEISVSPKVEYVPAEEVEGVEFLGMLDLKYDENGDVIATENYGSGVMTYKGSDPIKVGEVIAVHDGEVDERGYSDGRVTYVKITKILGNNQYEYERAGLEDVLFLADNIPVPDDGSLDDGRILVEMTDIRFSDPVFASYGLDENSALEKGDYLTFYQGTLGGDDYRVTGHGIVVGIEELPGALQLRYELRGEEELLDDELLLYMEMPEADIELTETDSEALSSDMEKQILESGLVEETTDFLTGLLLGEEIDFDEFEHGDELRNMAITTDEGEITLEDLRKLADGGSSVEVSDVHVTFLGGLVLQHFEGKKGLRAEVAVTFTIEIGIADAGKLEIQPAIVLEQEFLLTPKIKVVRHKNKLGLTSSLDITASLEAGTYSGFGVSVTAKTKDNPDPNADKDWEETVGDYLYNGDDSSLEARTNAAKLLINGGNLLLGQAEMEQFKGQGIGADKNFGDGDDKSGEDSKQDYVSPGIGGDLPTKYSNMLSNDAEYINLVDQDLGSADFPIDPMGIIHCGIKIKFVVAFKINAMIGSGLTYENAKLYSYSFRAKIWGGGDEGKNISNGSSVKDIATPNFRVDFYAFGMVGLRIGVSIDLRVGIFSTDLDSVGVVASAGVYAEAYGFLYCWYEWTSGQGSTNGAMGSLLFECGIYTDISVKVQVGMGKASKSWSLYSSKTPLLQLGCVQYPIDYVIESNDSKLDLKIESGENTVKVPDELFEINLMALSSGELSAKNMDSRHVCETDARSFTAEIKTSAKAEQGEIAISTKRSWTQYNEDHFAVECFDLDGNKGKVKSGPSSFQYLPATNEIFVNPLDTTADELWGKVVFTYKNTAFGFSTQKLQRTVYVHWKGVQRTAVVEYYLQENSTEEAYASGYVWTHAGTGNVSGYDGIRCYVEVTPDLVNRFNGYQFIGMSFPDEAELREKYEKALTEYKGAATRARSATIEMTANKNAATEKAYKEASDRYMQAKATYELCYDLYARYYDNNQEVFRNLSGTTYFTMRGTTTVIRVYYKKLDVRSAWMIVKEGDETPVLYNGRTVIRETPIMDLMPEEMKNYQDDLYHLNWYVYTFGGSYLSHAVNWAAVMAKNGNVTYMTPLTEDMVPPAADNVVIVGILSPKEFTVHFMHGDEEFASAKVRHGDLVIPPASAPTEEGYTFVNWTLGDGTPVTAENPAVMPTNDLYVNAVFLGRSHDLTWITNEGKEAKSSGRTGDLLYDIVPAELKANGQFYMWRTGSNDYSTELPLDYALGNENLTLYGRSSLGFANLTWVGDTTFTTTVEVGTMPKRPAVTPREGEDVVWMVNGAAMQDNFVMPSENVTATAYYHVHEWVKDDSSVIPATCSATGRGGSVCKLCGLTGGEVLPIDPDNHNFTDYVIEAATCTKQGTMGHKCLWCGTEKTSTIAIDPENHVHTSLRNALTGTCGDPGYTGDLVCDDCSKVLQAGTVIPANGNHTSGGTYEYKRATCAEDGYEGHLCFNCHQLVIDRVLPADPEKHVFGETHTVLQAPTCGAAGVAEYVCTVCGAKKTEPIPATGEHTWDDAKATVVTPSTCTVRGKASVPCSVCGAVREVSLALDANNHLSLGAPETTAEPTCTGAGESRRQCPDCGNYVTEILPALGHDWGTVVYTWSEDNNRVTAVRPCNRNHDHDATETVRTDFTVTKAPTCTETGITVYTTRAFTTNTDAFTVQTKNVETPAAGHSWGVPTYVWSSDYSQVTAKRICGNDGTHVEQETVATTSAITKAPTVYERGETTYTAAFSNPAFAAQTKAVENLDSLDPNWSAAEYVWSANYQSCTATRVSRTDPTLKETETKGASATETRAAKCETAGEMQYKVLFENEAFGTQIKLVEIPALGHAWTLKSTVDPEPIFTADGDTEICTGWKTGLKTYECSHDTSHTKSETVKVPTAIFNMAPEWMTAAAHLVTIDLSVPDEAYTLEGFVEGTELKTVGDIIETWVGIVPYNAETNGWWNEEYENEELKAKLYNYILKQGIGDDLGRFVYQDSSQSSISLLDPAYRTNGTLIVTLSFVPDDAATFESIETITVTIKWPTT